MFKDHGHQTNKLKKVKSILSGGILSCGVYGGLSTGKNVNGRRLLKAQCYECSRAINANPLENAVPQRNSDALNNQEFRARPWRSRV